MNSRARTLVIFAAIGGVLLLVVLLLLPRSSAPPTISQPQLPTRPTASIPPGAPPQFAQPETDPLLTEPAPSPSPLNVPTGATIDINGIQVRNFYSTSRSVDAEGTVALVENNDFTILYYPQSQQFLISILNAPFETYRQQAEAVLLAQLGVTELETCSLSIDITTPAFANPDQAGRNFNPSFCPGN